MPMIPIKLERKDGLVRVVRCKDCKWFDRISDNSCFGYCHASEHCFRSKDWDVNIYRTHKEDFYCADGDRREDETD